MPPVCVCPHAVCILMTTLALGILAAPLEIATSRNLKGVRLRVPFYIDTGRSDCGTQVHEREHTAVHCSTATTGMVNACHGAKLLSKLAAPLLRPDEPYSACSDQEATQRAVGQFDAAVLEIDAEEAAQLAAVEDAMRRLRVCSPAVDRTCMTVCKCPGWMTTDWYFDRCIIAKSPRLATSFSRVAACLADGDVQLYRGARRSRLLTVEGHNCKIEQAATTSKGGNRIYETQYIHGWSECRLPVQAEDADRASARVDEAESGRARLAAALRDVHAQKARAVSANAAAAQQAGRPPLRPTCWCMLQMLHVVTGDFTSKG